MSYYVIRTRHGDVRAYVYTYCGLWSSIYSRSSCSLVSNVRFATLYYILFLVLRVL